MYPKDAFISTGDFIYPEIVVLVGRLIFDIFFSLRRVVLLTCATRNHSRRWLTNQLADLQHFIYFLLQTPSAVELLEPLSYHLYINAQLNTPIPKFCPLIKTVFRFHIIMCITTIFIYKYYYHDYNAL